MKILSITAQKVDSTGSGVFLTELVRGFRKAGHQQAVICGTMPGDTICLPEGVAVYPVCFRTEQLPFAVCGMSDEMPYESTRYSDMTEEMTRQLFDAFRRQVQETVCEFQPDVILCHHLYFLAALVRELCPDIPVYGQCHGSDLRQFRKNSWMQSYISDRIPQLDGIFALHDQQREQICRIHAVPEQKVRVMGTGYNSDVFRILPAAEKEDKPQKLRLIFAGKLSEKKGIISLLASLWHLEHPERVEVALAGGAGNKEDYEKIRALAAAAPCQVTLLGKLNHEQLARELNNSDVFILPSFYEGLPLVLMEAMACGLRVICTDLPGIRPWMDRTIENHGVLFVEPPEMRNEDDAVPQSLTAFEHRLAEAIRKIQYQPFADMEAVRAVSWDALCKKMTTLWQK